MSTSSFKQTVVGTVQSIYGFLCYAADRCKTFSEKIMRAAHDYSEERRVSGMTLSHSVRKKFSKFLGVCIRNESFRECLFVALNDNLKDDKIFSELRRTVRLSTHYNIPQNNQHEKHT